MRLIKRKKVTFLLSGGGSNLYEILKKNFTSKKFITLSIISDNQISMQIIESSLIRYMTGCKVIVSNQAFQKDPDLYSKLSQQSETLTGYILGTCEIPKDDARYSEEDTFWYSVKIFDSILHEVSPKFLSYQSPFGKSVQGDTFPQQEKVPMATIQTSVQESELESMATRTSISYSNHDRNEVHEKPSLKPEIVSMHEVTNDNYYHDLFDDVKKGTVSVKTILFRISAGKDTIFHDGKSKCCCRCIQTRVVFCSHGSNFSCIELCLHFHVRGKCWSACTHSHESIPSDVAEVVSQKCRWYAANGDRIMVLTIPNKDFFPKVLQIVRSKQLNSICNCYATWVRGNKLSEEVEIYFRFKAKISYSIATKSCNEAFKYLCQELNVEITDATFDVTTDEDLD